jgi:hypothetical protein
MEVRDETNAFCLLFAVCLADVPVFCPDGAYRVGQMDE